MITDQDQLLKQRILLAMNFIYISGGQLRNQSGEEKFSAVKPFWISHFYLTAADWQRFKQNTEINFCQFEKQLCDINFEQAKIFIEQISQAYEINFRLPTENEWIYTALLYGQNNMTKCLNLPLSKIGENGYFYAKPDTWEMTADLYAATKPLKAKDNRLYFIAKKVNLSPGQFMASLYRQRKIEVEEKAQDLSFRLVHAN